MSGTVYLCAKAPWSPPTGEGWRWGVGGWLGLYVLAEEQWLVQPSVLAPGRQIYSR